MNWEMIHFLSPWKLLIVESGVEFKTTIKALSNSQKSFHIYFVLFWSDTQKQFLESESSFNDYFEKCLTEIIPKCAF